MSGYFKSFPLVQYNGFTVTNITRRAAIAETIFGQPYVYMPYTIKGDDRPEDIAFYYYDDPQLVWLVNLSNKIVNPYYDWPISSKDFDNMIIKKYAAQSGLSGNNVINWTLNTTITQNIVHAVNIENPNVKISAYSYLNLSTQSAWRPVRIYDYENDLNESKRIIYLVNKIYVSQVEKELKKVLNG